MISVDTSVVVRLLAGDDRPQFEKAKGLFEKENIFVATSVVMESEWVLRCAYAFTRDDIIRAFKALFGLPNVTLQEQTIISQALDWHQQGFDFADALHLAASNNCESFMTFDRKFVKIAAPISDLPVKIP